MFTVGTTYSIPGVCEVEVGEEGLFASTEDEEVFVKYEDMNHETYLELQQELTCSKQSVTNIASSLTGRIPLQIKPRKEGNGEYAEGTGKSQRE